MEIIPQVHSINGVTGAKSFLLIDDTLTLIDTGYSGNGEKILRYIESIGENPEKLTRIIATHYHPDHISSVPEIIAHTPAKLLLHPADIRHISGDKIEFVMKTGGSTRLLKRWQTPKLPVNICEFVNDGDIIPCLGGLQVIHTPGHSPGSISLYLLKQKALFPGDAIVNAPRLMLAYLPMRQSHEKCIQSLQKLSELDIDACLFSHGQPIFDNVSPKLRYLLKNPVHFTVRGMMIEKITKQLHRRPARRVKRDIPVGTTYMDPSSPLLEASYRTPQAK